MSVSPSRPVDRVRHLVARTRTVTGIDAALRAISRPPPPSLAPLPPEAVGVILYAPADLNQVDGSAIWVQSVVDTLVTDPRIHVTVPLRAPERRMVVTGHLRGLDRVDVVDPHPRIAARRTGLSIAEGLDLVEQLDRARPADAIILRSYALCLAAIERPGLRDRIWATFILEPERDTDDPAYRQGLDRIARTARLVVVQSDGMRRLLGEIAPASVGRTALLPPAIPADGTPRADAGRPVRRLVYTGKFHPFYPIDHVMDIFVELRSGPLPDLEFHVAGDKFMTVPDDPDYGVRLAQRLRTTAGVVWHGALSRAATARLLAEGGVAISLWDYRFGPRMNDLVVSTKLLDYAAAGLPTVLTRTVTQQAMLGPEYPLFVDELAEARAAILRALTDGTTYRAAAERAFAASRAFTYPAVMASLRPYLEADEG